MNKILSLVLITLIPLSLVAQDGSITGVVTTDEGDALVGANIQVLGTDLGAVTTDNGTFSVAACVAACVAVAACAAVAVCHYV